MSVLNWWGGWVPAFVLTCAIEVPPYLMLFELSGILGSTGRDRSSLPIGRAALLVVGVNAISHPLLWWVALGLQGPSSLVLAELGVVVVEALLIFAVLRRRMLACLLCSLVANAASAVLGSAILSAVTSSVALASTTSTWPG